MVATTFISKERLKAVRRVAVADCVAKESLETGSGIAVGYSAASQRLKTIGGVVAAGCVVVECFWLVGRIVGAAGVTKSVKKPVATLFLRLCWNNAALPAANLKPRVVLLKSA